MEVFQLDSQAIDKQPWAQFKLKVESNNNSWPLRVDSGEKSPIKLGSGLERKAGIGFNVVSDVSPDRNTLPVQIGVMSFVFIICKNY